MSSNFRNRKSIHINISKDTHSGLRILLFQHHLSMQEVFDEFANQLVAQESNFMKNFLNSIIQAKKDNVRNFSNTDSESIYKIIEDESEFEV
jgi:hypothetical protein